MKTKQFVGPFSDNIIDTGLAGRTIRQIGMERPHSPLITQIPQTVYITINGITYSIGEKDILEFENLVLVDPAIKISDNSPYFILDIGYN